MATNKDIGVYIIQNSETMETYIGSGILEQRFKTHSSLLAKKEHWNYKLQKAYNKDQNFEFISVLIDDPVSLEDNRNTALQIEQMLIDEFKESNLLLNISTNVEKTMMGYKHRPESNEKNRQAAKERWQNPEYREKMSIALRKGWDNLSEERKAKNSISYRNAQYDKYKNGERSPTLGQKRSEEFCKRNSEMVKKLWQDSDHREKVLKAQAGKVYAPNKKPVLINGIEYPSITHAAKEHNITKEGMAYRCATDSFPNFQFKNI